MKLTCCGCVLLLAWSVQVPSQIKLEMSAQEKEILELTNAERKKKELQPLRPNPVLFQAARAHARNMAKQGKLEHTLDDKNPSDRVRDAGYKFTLLGENIARFSNKTPAEFVMKTWMDSKIHRENILNPEFTDIGLGLAMDNNGQVYYTQDFAKPR